MKTRAALPVVLSIACCGVAFSAQQQPSAAGAITADKVERLAGQTLKAVGNVTIVGSDFQLRADSVEVRERGTASDPETEILAEGNVVLTRGEERITLQHLRFDPRTGKGTFELPPGKK